MVEQHGSRVADWPAKAEALGTGRSPAAVGQHWYQVKELYQRPAAKPARAKQAPALPPAGPEQAVAQDGDDAAAEHDDADDKEVAGRRPSRRASAVAISYNEGALADAPPRP